MFGLKHNPAPIVLNGTSLPWSDSYKHLGHLLYKDGSLKFDVDLKEKVFYWQVSRIKARTEMSIPHCTYEFNCNLHVTFLRE